MMSFESGVVPDDWRTAMTVQSYKVRGEETRKKRRMYAFVMKEEKFYEGVKRKVVR